MSPSIRTTRSLAATAAHLGVPKDALVLTNGLDEGILATAVVRAAWPSGGDAIVCVPAFDMYAVCADAAGGRVLEVPHQCRLFVSPARAC